MPFGQTKYQLDLEVKQRRIMSLHVILLFDIESSVHVFGLLILVGSNRRQPTTE